MNNIKLKSGYTLNYRHQIINADVDDFVEEDYNSLCDFASQYDNEELLGWDLDNPGEWDCIDWKLNTATNKYHIYDCYFDCLDVKGNIDLTNSNNIDELSFSGSDIETIELPAINIGDSAFYDCPNLEAVIITSGTTSIGKNAFKYCDSLQAVYIPESVTTIDTTAFSDCSNIKIAGTSGSYAETFATANNIPFESGYFLCGKICTKKNKEGTFEYYYPVEDVSIKDSDILKAQTDKNGYFTVFGLSNDEYNYVLNYIFGFNLNLTVEISNSSLIVNSPIAMVSCNFNGDSIINSRDFSQLVRMESSDKTAANYKYFDVNKDGTITNEDWLGIGLLNESYVPTTINVNQSLGVAPALYNELQADELLSNDMMLSNVLSNGAEQSVTPPTNNFGGGIENLLGEDL